MGDGGRACVCVCVTQTQINRTRCEQQGWGVWSPHTDFSNLRRESGQRGPRWKGFLFHRRFITVLTEWLAGPL